MGERAHTPGPWSAQQVKGWGRDLCIVDADGAVIFRPVKPKAYYTDYAPGREPGSVILSDEIARKQGRYVATPEIKAVIDADETKRAAMAAAAPDMFEALWQCIGALKALGAQDGYASTAAKAALAKAEGLGQRADATPKNPLSEGRERS